MKDIKALGENVIVRTDLKTHDRETEYGIIYKESQLNATLVVWSQVHSIGPDVKVDVRVGDWVAWKLNTAVGHFKLEDTPYDIIPFHELLVIRDAT
jgi:hypothetical protein